MTVNKESTVWLNVTTSSQWNRAVVGVVRVETELASGLAKLYPKGRFKYCIWQDGSFIEKVPGPTAADSTPGVESQRAIQGAIESSDALQPSGVKAPLPMLFPLLSKRNASKSIAQGVLSLLPSCLRRPCNYLLHILIGVLKRLIYSARYRQFKERSRALSRMPGVFRAEIFGDKVFGREMLEHFTSLHASIFTPGDVLLSVGLDWDYPYAEEFMRLRSQESVKVVRCCYDLIPVLYPQYCVADVAAHFTRYFLDVADSSDQVLCISKQSENDLRYLLQRTGGRAVNTKVFTLGDNIVEGLSDSIGDTVRNITAAPFILYVSTVERRKNHQVLYQAYHQLCKEGKKEHLPKMVFVGMRGWGVDELFKDIELDPATAGSIIQCNHVNDAELRLLYQQSLCCVFPSLYEGWGLPVGEALAMGKIVLSSDRGSLPEVGGELVTYIDPWHPGEWARAIWRIVTDDEHHKMLSEKVDSNYEPRQWHDTAVSVKSILDDLMAPQPALQIEYCAYDLTTSIGQCVGPVINSRGRQGLLFEGPHKALLSGQYRLEIWAQPDQRAAGRCSVQILGDGTEIAIREQVAFNAVTVSSVDESGNKNKNEQPLLSLPFQLPVAVKDFDVRCELMSGELCVERIVLVPQ